MVTMIFCIYLNIKNTSLGNKNDNFLPTFQVLIHSYEISIN